MIKALKMNSLLFETTPFSFTFFFQSGWNIKKRRCDCPAYIVITQVIQNKSIGSKRRRSI